MLRKLRVLWPHSVVLVLFSLLLLVTSGCTTKQGITPPVAKKIPKETSLHGDVRIDNYSWLQDRSNPEVVEYIEAENRYTEEMMKPTLPLEERLYQELVGRIKEIDISVPEKVDDYYYYSRTEEGKQYRIDCRKKGSLDAPEEILLDRNELAAGHKALGIRVFEVSPNHKLLAYSVDLDGAENYVLSIKDLATGKIFDDQIQDIAALEWANDNKTIFYVKVDQAKRPFQLYRHPLGTDPKQDPMIYEEKDEVFNLDLSKTKTEAYLLATSSSATSAEVRYLEADQPSGNFKVIHPRQANMLYEVDHYNDKFFILTNDNAINFKLIEVSVKNPSKENWREVIPHRDSVMLEGIDVFKSHLVVYERDRGLKKIRITNLKDNTTHFVEFAEPAYTFQPGRNEDFASNVLRFTYTSLVTPSSVFDYDMNTKSRDLKKQDEVKGYDPALYQSERIFAKAPDGVMVPISLVYKKGITRDGKNPLYLEGYGAYGSSRDPRFDATRMSLLDRGFIYAIAHIRGGGDMGRQWYEDGKFLKKKNTFTDFIACAEHLIAEKYTSSDRLVIRGGSAGGILMGAVVNMRPDLFKVVNTRVPFVDVLNVMLDTSLPLTAQELEEWGDPSNKEYYFYIKSYSPYDNVLPQNYPHILVTGGFNDPRVRYWEPLKWTAKLRALKKDKNVLLLKINMAAGHGGSTGRYDALKETAFNYAFILDRLGIKE
jgi:oligopeptidase B